MYTADVQPALYLPTIFLPLLKFQKVGTFLISFSELQNSIRTHQNFASAHSAFYNLLSAPEVSYLVQTHQNRQWKAQVYSVTFVVDRPRS